MENEPTIPAPAPAKNKGGRPRKHPLPVKVIVPPGTQDAAFDSLEAAFIRVVQEAQIGNEIGKAVS